ncbi:unnamed protein product [Rhizophagus irregularis]|uniref:Uncharacterized protein n=1 Tax=Rhizophagus irregularis TaxID=588596 RepID=A0A2I1H6N3_9GLOM|nr:hypothetical protein RhiirA4_409862 [Rhizophagus irregularis]CAB4432098.1 unnamed protein product [Rhizophagus irregularis]CAB4432312.1 unnamed protein product [Rhizophagus irregularis]
MSNSQNSDAKHVRFIEPSNDNTPIEQESGRFPSTLSVSTTTSTNTEQKHKKKTREVQSRYMQSVSNNSNDKTAVPNKNQDGKKTAASDAFVGGKRFNIKPIKVVQKQLGMSRLTVQKHKAESLKFAPTQTNLSKNHEAVSQKALQDTYIPAENHNLDDEIVMLNARLTQWCFINAKAERAFECQKRTAEAQLLDAWELLVEKQEELSKTSRKFTLEKEIIFLNTTLKLQQNILLQINEHFEIFKKHYISFASSLASTTTTMPIANIITGELGQLKDEIITCSLVAEDVLRKWDMESPLIHDVAFSMYVLCTNIKEGIQELNECNALLREISEAETIEASLRIQKVETI